MNYLNKEVEEKLDVIEEKSLNSDNGKIVKYQTNVESGSKHKKETNKKKVRDISF